MDKVEEVGGSQSMRDDHKGTSSGCTCCGGCARWIRRLVPIGCLTEVRELARLALPLILSQLLYFVQSLVSSIFCGHLGKEELDAVTLGNAVMAVTGYSIGIGFFSATDTLISQIYGGKNMKRIGLIMQQAIIVLFLICMPCWALFLNTENLLLLVKQDPKVSRLSAQYTDICIPALLWVFIYQLQTSFLQNQGITLPQVFIGVATNVINAVLHYVFLFVVPLGVRGAGVAINISRIAQICMAFLYIFIKKLHVEVWGGWSMDCLQHWGSLTSLALPSILIVCFEWWIYEIGTVLTGLISVSQLAAQSVMYQVVIMVYMIPYSLGVAVCVRVGNALGSGDAEQAKRSSLIAFLCTGFLCAVDIAVIAGLRTVIPRVFSSEEDIIALTSRTLLVYSLFHIFESLSCTANGILRGIGKQKIGAVVYGVGYYVVGLPITVTLMFVVKLGILGLWAGMTICALIPGVILTTYIFRVNWMTLREEAQERVGLKQNGAAGQESSYTWPHSEEDKENSVVFHNGVQSEGFSDQIPLKEICATRDVPLEEGLLPVRTLILRRGLVAMAAVLILVVGILVRVLLEPSYRP